MYPIRFDAIAKFVATRRLSRRQALTRAGAGLAAAGAAAAGLGAPAAASTVTPSGAENLLADESAAALVPPAGVGITVFDPSAANATAIATLTASGAKPLTFLFLQSFERGSLVPKPDSPGRYTLTLKQGLGDTVYFSDRPAKVVGTVPTAQFLKGLGFPPNNPPNAALVGQRSPSHRDIVVVELFDPRYDASTNTLTYEVALLQDWRKLGETFEQTPDSAAQLPRAFTAAQLFIDDCPDLTTCTRVADFRALGPLPGGPSGRCWSWSDFNCLPCQDRRPIDSACNQAYPACQGGCYAT